MSAERIEERAAHYLLRREESGWSMADQVELDGWLRESTLHEVAYLRLEHGWRKVGRASILRGDSNLSTPVAREQSSPVAAAPAQGRRSPWTLAAAATLAVLAIGLWQSGLFVGDRYSTGIGGHATVPLADGSRIELNTDTRLRTALDATARSVWLDRGEAYFDVAADPIRPFLIHAGAQRVRVLGTKFSVRREGRRLQVNVTEGRVQMETNNAAVAAPTLVAGGQRAIAQGGSVTLHSEPVERLANELSWRQGNLVFDQTTLAEAAAEFNRYNRRQLVIDSSIAQIRIGGSFEATNLGAFVRLLRNSFGLKVVEERNEISISN